MRNGSFTGDSLSSGKVENKKENKEFTSPTLL